MKLYTKPGLLEGQPVSEVYPHTETPTKSKSYPLRKFILKNNTEILIVWGRKIKHPILISKNPECLENIASDFFTVVQNQTERQAAS